MSSSSDDDSALAAACAAAVVEVSGLGGGALSACGFWVLVVERRRCV